MRSRKKAVLLCLLLGWTGLHRLYLGRRSSAAVYFMTLGVFGLGWLIDLIILLRGGFKESFLHYSPRLSAISIDAIRDLSPQQFEWFVGAAFTALGYEVIVTGRSRDGGVDLVVCKDGATGIVQCKRYHGTVTPSVVRDLYGTMMHRRADFAYLVTTGQISDGVFEWVSDKPIHLIDSKRMVTWLQHADFALGASGKQYPLYDAVPEPIWGLFAGLLCFVWVMLPLVLCNILLVSLMLSGRPR